MSEHLRLFSAQCCVLTAFKRQLAKQFNTYKKKKKEEDYGNRATRSWRNKNATLQH